MPAKFYTRDEVALLLRVDRQTVAALIKKKKLKSYRATPKTVLVAEEDLAAYMKGLASC